MAMLKELSDETKAQLSEDFARLNLTDRDNVIFDFEADIKKMIRNLNIKKLLKKDRKYMKGVRNFIMQIVLSSYLKDMINVGVKKVNRYKRFYVGANGNN